MDIAYELGGLTGFIAILLIALGYGGWRTGWFSRQEGARTDDATLKFNVVVNRAVDGREVHTSGHALRCQIASRKWG